MAFAQRRKMLTMEVVTPLMLAKRTDLESIGS